MLDLNLTKKERVNIQIAIRVRKLETNLYFPSHVRVVRWWKEISRKECGSDRLIRERNAHFYTNFCFYRIMYETTIYIYTYTSAMY